MSIEPAWNRIELGGVVLVMAYCLVLKRYAPFTTFGGGFEGDSRTGPSPDRAATARTVGVVDFDISDITPVIYGYSSGTRWRRNAAHSFAKVAASITVKTKTATSLSFIAYTAGANPLVPASPDIDTFVDLSITFHNRSIVFEGRVRGDSFPNAEVWAYDDPSDGNYVLLFDYRTEGGRNTGPLRLPGSHSSSNLGQIFLTVPMERTGRFLACCFSETVHG
jgi:hypothetical protein